MKKPFFSVVIPLYNKEYSVERAVSSVLAQSFSNFELLIVDDGSTDRSVEVILDFDDPRLVLLKQSNNGPSSARNYGFKSSSADFICFLDADDEWDSAFLETMFSLVEIAPNASMYSVKFKVVDEDGRVFCHVSDFPDSYMGYIDDFYKAYADRGLVNSSSVCIRKKSLHAIGGFPEHARIGEDIYTWLILADMYQVAYANVECVTIHRDAENRSDLSVRKEMPYHIKTVLEGKAKEFSEENRGSVMRFVSKNTVLHVAGAVLKGDRRGAFIMAWKLWGFSYSYGGRAFCVAILPRTLLEIVKKIRNKS